MKHFLKASNIFVVFLFIMLHSAHDSALTEKEVAASEENVILTDSPTMESIQEELITYLKKTHPGIRFGSKKFMEYANGVCMEDIDPELAKLPNYEEIQFYCAEYLHALDEEQVKRKIPFWGFRPSGEFTSKTIEDIKKEAQEKEKLDEIEYQKVRDHSQ